MASMADEIRQIVEQVLKSYDVQALLGGTAAALPKGVFADIDGAVAAALIAQRELVALPLDTRRRMIEAMRQTVLEANASLSEEAVRETGLGNVRDKKIKNALAARKTPGVEDVEPGAFSDEHGLTITEHAPYGVIGAITPCSSENAPGARLPPGCLARRQRVLYLLVADVAKAGSRTASWESDAFAARTVRRIASIIRRRMSSGSAMSSRCA